MEISYSAADRRCGSRETDRIETSPGMSSLEPVQPGRVRSGIRKILQLAMMRSHRAEATLQRSGDCKGCRRGNAEGGWGSVGTVLCKNRFSEVPPPALPGSGSAVGPGPGPLSARYPPSSRKQGCTFFECITGDDGRVKGKRPRSDFRFPGSPREEKSPAERVDPGLRRFAASPPRRFRSLKRNRQRNRGESVPAVGGRHPCVSMLNAHWHTLWIKIKFRGSARTIRVRFFAAIAGRPV